MDMDTNQEPSRLRLGPLEVHLALGTVPGAADTRDTARRAPPTPQPRGAREARTRGPRPRAHARRARDAPPGPGTSGDTELTMSNTLALYFL